MSRDVLRRLAQADICKLLGRRTAAPELFQSTGGQNQQLSPACNPAGHGRRFRLAPCLTDSQTLSPFCAPSLREPAARPLHSGLTSVSEISWYLTPQLDCPIAYRQRQQQQQLKPPADVWKGYGSPIHSLLDPSHLSQDMWADSVRRKRKKKMNKHKHRKRTKKLRHRSK